MRIALGIEYAGNNFAGWQIQSNTRSVQECVETALSKVANHPVKVTCAGRTDTGVHALGQVIHADVTAQRTMHSWVFGANANLSKDISVLWAIPVDDNFHARFSALTRHYRYIILNRGTRPALLAKRVTWNYKPLEVEWMQTAANYLLGTHDFSSYRAVACQAKNPTRTISYLNVSRSNERILLDISANAFLHHMVRNIAGVLMTIGSGEQPPEWARTVLNARDRTRGGITAPADGLYLCGVDYPKPYIFPKITFDW
jgi:tRNA pseudouridine38-40 synthase